MGLREYKARRDFTRTKEPAGKAPPPKIGKDLSFVVQKHDATRLHFDFRLEMEGVLKSWAVPKGIPTRRGDRRLAVQVEDHPLDYATFEGTIPPGNYGAGTVMVWDRGIYRAFGNDPLRSLAEGKLHLWIEGSKIHGEWTLVRMRDRDQDKPQWLLFKSGTDADPFTDEQEARSAATGRTLEEIAGARKKKEWESNRPAKTGTSAKPKRQTGKKTRRSTPNSLNTLGFEPKLSGLPQTQPKFIDPMKATLANVLPRGREWAYEIKFDGIRALAIKDGSEVTLWSRAENLLTAKYPEVTAAVQQLPVGAAVLDGEVVALDQEGRSSFQLLQAFNMSLEKPPLFYYVFDVLNLEGRDVRSLPLSERKELTRLVLQGAASTLRFSPALEGDTDLIVSEMQSRGLEGLVAKRLNSTYESGRRSSAWTKFKWSNEQEFVIGGYTEPKGARSYFGALLVGYYNAGKLRFAGKVGTGFNERLLKELYKRFQPLLQKQCPFTNLPEPRTGRYGGGLTASQMRLCTWVKPELVCQVRFAEWTRDNHLRQPAFLGLREDKRAEEVVREGKAS